MGLKFFVLIANPYLCLSLHIFADLRYGKTALCEGPRITAFLQDLRVDEGLFECLERLGIFFLAFGKWSGIHYEKSYRTTDLRCGESNPLGIVHGFIHPGNERIQARVVQLNALGFLFQYGIAVGDNGKYHGCNLR